MSASNNVPGTRMPGRPETRIERGFQESGAFPDNDMVDTRLLTWQPSRDELAWERLGWLRNLGDARRVASRTNRPMFLLVCPLDREIGPTGELALQLRQRMIPSSPMPDLLRNGWVPALQELPRHPNARAESAGAVRDVRNLADPTSGSDERVELHDAKGRLLETFAGTAWRDSDLLSALRRNGSSGRVRTGLPDRPAWEAPAIPDGGLRLRIVSRFVERGSGAWRPLSKPDDIRSTVYSRRWVTLNALEALSTGPREGHAVPGESWTIEPGIAERVCRAMIPNVFAAEAGNLHVLSCRLDAEVTQIGRGCSVRLTGFFRMNLPSKRNGSPFECSGRWGGYAVFGADRLPRTLRLCTHEGIFIGHPFGAVAGEH